MLCRDWSLVHRAVDHIKVIPLKCRCWTCELCVRERKRELIRRLFEGRPERWMTLTVNANNPGTPIEHRVQLAEAFNDLQKRIRRKWPRQRFEFAAVVEKTEKGEPHLHIAFRGPWIPQQWLSDQMADLCNSPICDVRWLHGKKQIMGYIAKYIGKKPHQFGTKKRYWFSKKYAEHWRTKRGAADGTKTLWHIEEKNIALFLWDHPYPIWEPSWDRDQLTLIRRC